MMLKDCCDGLDMGSGKSSQGTDPNVAGPKVSQPMGVLSTVGTAHDTSGWLEKEKMHGVNDGNSTRRTMKPKEVKPY